VFVCDWGMRWWVVCADERMLPLHVLQTPNPLQAIARLLGESEGRRIESEWARGGQLVKVALTPQRWAGRGLLGCHLQPLR